MRILKTLSIAALGAAVMAGCSNPTGASFNATDGAAGTMTAELNSMGNTAESAMTGNSAAKSLADTLYIEKIVAPWAYNAANGFWTRSAEALFPNGTHIRIDTVWFYDANNKPVGTPSISNVASYRHVRIVADSLKHTWNYRLDMNVTINKTPGDTEFVHNGSSSGVFNGETFKTTTITNVTRQWLGDRIPHQQFPSAGTITIDGLLRDITIQFGNGIVTATEVRNRDGKTVVINIDISTGVETAR